VAALGWRLRHLRGLGGLSGHGGRPFRLRMNVRRGGSHAYPPPGGVAYSSGVESDAEGAGAEGVGGLFERFFRERREQRTANGERGCVELELELELERAVSCRRTSVRLFLLLLHLPGASAARLGPQLRGSREGGCTASATLDPIVDVVMALLPPSRPNGQAVSAPQTNALTAGRSSRCTILTSPA
jgi:hypothetical protein